MALQKGPAHRVIFMDQGEIVEDALKEEFFARPAATGAQEIRSKIYHT